MQDFASQPGTPKLTLEEALSVAHKHIYEAQIVATEILAALSGPMPESGVTQGAPMRCGVMSEAQLLGPRLTDLTSDLRRAHAMLTAPNVQGIASAQYDMNNFAATNNAYGRLG